MSRYEKEGGPAFPVVQGVGYGDGGATLRDLFAIHALTTSLGYDRLDIAAWEPVDFARHAYQVADAMLAERVK